MEGVFRTRKGKKFYQYISATKSLLTEEMRSSSGELWGEMFDEWLGLKGSVKVYGT